MERTQPAKKNIGKAQINLIISILIFLLGCLLPGMGQITKSGMLVLGFLISAIYAWVSGVDAWFPILLLLAYSQLSGLSFTTDLMPAVFGNYMIWFILFCFWYMDGIQRSGLLNYLTYKLLGLRAASKGPYWLMTLLLITSWAVSALTQAVSAIMVLMLVILKNISDNLELPKYNAWTACCGVGIVVASVVGTLVMPFNVTFYMYSGLVGGSAGWANDLNMGIYTLQQVLASVFMIALLVAVTKFIIRPKVDFGRLSNLHISGENGSVRFTRPMGYTLLTVLVLLLVVSVPSLAPQGSVLYNIFNRIGLAGAFAICCIILALTKGEDHEPLFDFKEKMQSATNWNMFFYLAVLFYVSNLMNDAGTGISAQISTWCAPLTSLRPVLLIAILGLIAVIVTNVANNFVTCMIIAPIGYAVLGTSGIYSDLMTVMVIVCSYIACALPISSFGGIALYMQKDVMFKSNQLLKYGYLFSIIGYIGQLLALLICKNFY